MKKKIVLVTLLVLLILVPAFSATTGSSKKGSVGVGANLGTVNGVALRFGMGDFDLLANIGFDVLNISKDSWTIAGDVAASYKVYTIDGGRNAQFPITVGLSAVPSVTFGNNTVVNLDVLVPVGIEYTFSDVPITLYLRLAPGLSVIEANQPDVGFAMGGYIGALWNFN